MLSKLESKPMPHLSLLSCSVDECPFLNLQFTITILWFIISKVTKKVKELKTSLSETGSVTGAGDTLFGNICRALRNLGCSQMQFL